MYVYVYLYRTSVCVGYVYVCFLCVYVFVCMYVSVCVYVPACASLVYISVFWCVCVGMNVLVCVRWCLYK